MIEPVGHTSVQIPVFETGRIRLRAPRFEDLDAFYRFRSSERAAGVGGPHPDKAEALVKLESLMGHWQTRGYGRWLVADRETDAPLGVVGLMYPLDWPEPEIAWSLFDGAEGRGLAYEAAVFSRAYAYEVLGWRTAISCTTPDNTRSKALALRMGATYEGDYNPPACGLMNGWRHLGPEALQ